MSGIVPFSSGLPPSPVALGAIGGRRVLTHFGHRARFSTDPLDGEDESSFGPADSLLDRANRVR
jgi:hypothetical protein